MPWVQDAGPRASVAAGELHPHARNRHFSARHLTRLASSLAQAPRWQGFLLLRATRPSFHLSVKAPRKRKIIGKSYLHGFRQLFQLFLHTPSFSRGSGRCSASPSIRENSHGTGRRLCWQAVCELPSSEAAGPRSGALLSTYRD